MVRLTNSMTPRPRKLTRLQRTGRFIRRWWWLFAAGLAALAVAFVAFAFFGSVPLPDAAPGAQSSKILAADGQIVGTLHGEENRSIIPLDGISKNLQDAVIATEDRNFYSHAGVSLKGIARALFANVRGGGVTQGGSTLTQQYVRNAFVQVGRERTILRKVREAALAVKIERKFSKKKILEFYLNTVYFGRGAYGAEAAARTYFKKPAKDLDLGQAAYLAGIIRAPQLYQQERNPSGVKRIRDEVLGDMVEAGFVKKPEADKEKAEDINSEFKFGASAEIDSPRGAFFVEFVRRFLREEFEISDRDILGGGLEVHTTLDLRMQDAAEAAIASTLDRGEDPEAALVAMDPSGAVRAMVGGRDVKDLGRARGSNFAANVSKDDSSGRQAGSAFKPFALAAFVEDGKSMKSQFNAPAQIEIASNQCKDDKGNSWKVSNFDSEELGTVDVVQATTKSVNTVYAQMADIVTPRKMAQLIQDTGIHLPRREWVCALTLGTSPVTPLEMAQAYTTFAARGKRPDVLIVTKIVAPDGKIVAERKPKAEQKIDEEVADSVNFALEENMQRGTGTGAKLGRPAAGKTGTTQNHVDAWFAGYTPQLTAIVWMGFPPKETKDASGNTRVEIPEMTNVRGRRVTGGSFPATIWKKFMSEALKGVKGTDFASVEMGGEVLNPSPSPCPTATGAAPSSLCPSPTGPLPSSPPVPSISVSPAETPKPPGKTQSPSPAASASPSPSPSPT